MIRVAWFVIRSNERVILPKTNGTDIPRHNQSKTSHINIHPPTLYPSDFYNNVIEIKKGKLLDRNVFLRRLVDSLYRCRKDKAIVMATRPLDRDKWKNVPMNQLLAYEDGKLIYTGTKHEYEFVDSEEKMHMLFLDFANL